MRSTEFYVSAAFWAPAQKRRHRWAVSSFPWRQCLTAALVKCPRLTGARRPPPQLHLVCHTAHSRCLLSPRHTFRQNTGGGREAALSCFSLQFHQPRGPTQSHEAPVQRFQARAGSPTPAPSVRRCRLLRGEQGRMYLLAPASTLSPFLLLPWFAPICLFLTHMVGWGEQSD